MQRRTISIDDRTFRKIQQLRGRMISNGVIDDISFTSVVNLSLDMGVFMISFCTDEQLRKLIEIQKSDIDQLERNAEIDKKINDLIKKMLS